MWEELAIGAKKTKYIKTRQLLISGKERNKIIVNVSAWLLMMLRQT